MTTIDGRLTAAAEELKRSLECAPEVEFRRAATKLTNLAIAAAAAAVVLILVAVPVWLTVGNSGGVVHSPSATTSAQSPASVTLVAQLDDLGVINPVLLDDGTIVARAWSNDGPEDQPQPRGFGRSTDEGATWTFIPSDETMFRSGATLAAIVNVLVAPVWDAGTGAVSVLTSQDFGATWFEQELPVPDGYLPLGMRGGAVVVDEAGRFVVYGGNGKWTSTDGMSWEARTQNYSYRSLSWFPQIVDDVLVVSGEDDRIYVLAPGKALEVVLEPDAEGLRLAARNGEVLAWGTIPSDSDGTGTWLGITTDGRVWSEHTSDRDFTVVHQVSDDLGSGYLGLTFDPALDVTTVYRSPDLATWTEIARVETGRGAAVYQVVEVAGGVLVLAWADGQETLWLIDLGG